MDPIAHMMSGNQDVHPRKFKFFRVLLPGFSTRLSIPQAFVKYFIKENSAWATLLSPLGKSWNVKIHGDSKSLYFAEGWERFAEAHKLRVGDFLVFKYKGGLVFDLNIFDQSTCERQYVINGVASDRGPGQVENSEREFEYLKKQTAFSCGKRIAAMIEQVPCKTEPDLSEEQEAQMQDCQAQEATKGCRLGSCFALTIKPCHRYSLGIPAKFRESNNLSSIHQLFLRDPKGHLWPATLFHRHHTSHESSLLRAGWRDFRVGNSLEDGDVCIFELIKEKNEMNVQIHRRGRTLNSTKISDGDSRRLKRPFYEKTTAEVGKGSQSIETSPQFTSTMVPMNLRGRPYLNIPKPFLSSVDLSAESEAVLVDPSSRRWPVNICRGNTKDGGERVWLGNGWPAFRDANNIERVGDVCIFSFKSGMQEATFKVDVIKSEADAQ